MEKFIIHTADYRQQYSQFMQYLYTMGYRPASLRTLATGVREFFWWLERGKISSLQQVSEETIEAFYHYLQERPSRKGGTLSEGRITLNVYTLNLLFGYLQDVEQLVASPMSVLTYRGYYLRRRENLLSPEDVQKLYAVCPTVRHRALLGMLYGCGLRRQEAVQLNARNVHFKNGLLQITEGKGGSSRVIPVSKIVLSDFKEYYLDERPRLINTYHSDSIKAFMLNARGRRMQQETYTEEIRKLVKRAGVNERITLHHLRHAIATHLLERGMKVEHVKDFLGHKSLETTQTYTHVTDEQLKTVTGYGA